MLKCARIWAHLPIHVELHVNWQLHKNQDRSFQKGLCAAKNRSKPALFHILDVKSIACYGDSLLLFQTVE